ncbi:MAG: dynamin family protein [Campylobacterales bacterium]
MFKEKREFLKKRAEKLEQIAQELGEESLIGAISQFRESIERDLSFNLLCLGDFSSGKSTFINNFFIGEPLLPTNTTPTTAKLTILKYGEERRVLIRKKGGEVAEYRQNLREVLKRAGAKDGEELGEVEFIELYIDSPFLKDGIVVVDSPGLNDPEVERMKITLNYLQQADAVLYLLTALQAWKRSEKEFLEERVLSKRDIDKIFFLLNFWDLVPPEEREGLLKYLREQMEASLKVAEAELGEKLDPPPLIPISAKTKEGFEELYRLLWDYLAKQKGNRLIDVKERKLEELKRKISRFLQKQLDLLEQEEQSVEEELKGIEEELNRYRREAFRFRQRISNRVEEEVDRWFTELELFLLEVKEQIISKIEGKLPKIETLPKLEEEFLKAERQIIAKERGRLLQINKRFIQGIIEIAEQEKSQLDLDIYFPQRQIDYQELVQKFKIVLLEGEELLTTGDYLSIGSAVVSVLLATISAPLSLVGLIGVGYSLFLKGQEERKRVLKEWQNLQDEFEDRIERFLAELQLNREQIVEEIVNSIRNEVVDAFEEKKRLYNSIIEQKQSAKEEKRQQLLEKLKLVEEI